MRNDTTLGDDNVAEEFAQFFVVSDGELEVAGDDTVLLVITGSVTSQFENFSCEVFEDSSKVDRCTGTNTLGVVALLQETVDTTDGELKAGLG